LFTFFTELHVKSALRIHSLLDRAEYFTAGSEHIVLHSDWSDCWYEVEVRRY